MITANNFFGHWIKDIDIRQYPDDTRILPTNNNDDVYQYSASQLKYLPKNPISIIEKTLLDSKKQVYLDVDVDRRSNNNSNQTNCIEDNLYYRIGEFKDYIFQKNHYHIPLGILVDLGLVMKTDTNFLFSLQRSINKLFETRAKADSIPGEPDTLIQFHDWPCIAYQEINITQTFDIHLGGVLRSANCFKNGSATFPISKNA